MSEGTREKAGDRAKDPHLFLRPPRLFSLLSDGTLATAIYLVAFWLRFQGDLFPVFLPKTLTTLPVVAGGQLLGLAALGVYSPRLRVSWIARIVLGALTGTVVSSVVLAVAVGFEGVSRAVFVADALLFSTAAIAWRGVWVLRTRALARASARAVARGNDLVERAQEMITLRAIVESLYTYRELLRNLVLKDLKLKYRGSVFGFLWSLANPLLMIGVYSVAFTFILRVRGEGFVFYLMLGQLSWTFFSSSAAMSTGAIVDNAGLLKSVLFPRAILPIGTVLFNLAQFLLTISVFLPVMMIWYHVTPSGPMLLFPVFLALQVLFTVGVALILATSTAFFRDVRHLLEVALSVLFWTTPILYQLNQVPERLRLPILLSPVSPFVVAYHDLFFYQHWPEARVWLVATTHAFGAFVFGALLFLSAEDRFTEQL
jgi:ABC-type polysaccharide/polyol phosphate export permease